MVRELGIGGCERDLTRVAKGLDRARFQPHVGFLYPGGMRAPELQVAGVPVVHIPIRSLYSPASIGVRRQLRRYILEHGIQLIHTFDVPTDLVAIPVGWLSRVRVLIKSHLWFSNMVPRNYRALMAVTSRIADAVIVNSQAAERDLIQNFPAAKNKARLCYNGVETQVFSPDGSDRLEETGNSSILIGTACALRPEKRLDWLLEAYARVRGLGPGIRLLVVGSGSMGEQLEQQRRRLGIVGDSHFEPATMEVAPWLRSMDIFVLSSESESFPNALLEAMACGCCVIGSNVGGVPELIRHGQNGLLFEPGNIDDLAAQLTLAIRNEDVRRSLGAAAARTAREEFSAEINVRRTEEIYESLLRKTAPK